MSPLLYPAELRARSLESGRAYRPAQGEPQHDRDRERQDPPPRDARRGESGGRADRKCHQCRDQPVVADHELPPETPEAAQPGHARTSAVRSRVRRSRRSRRTSANEKSRTKPSTPRSAASEPGQSPPAPSTDQKIPNVVSITPTANFIAFSGTRASGARTATPTPATSTSAQAAPAAASGIEPCALPNVRTMNTTSSPSSSTPLKASVNPYQSTPARSRCAAPWASASSRAKIASSSCSAL